MTAAMWTAIIVAALGALSAHWRISKSNGKGGS